MQILLPVLIFLLAVSRILDIRQLQPIIRRFPSQSHINIRDEKYPCLTSTPEQTVSPTSTVPCPRPHSRAPVIRTTSWIARARLPDPCNLVGDVVRAAKPRSEEHT